MTGTEDRPELADVGRLARKLVGRAVRVARTEDQALRRVLLEHLGPDAARLPTVASSYPLYEHVNLQAGVDAWLAADPGRTHEVVGITGIGQLRYSDVTIGDFIQAGLNSLYGSAGVGAPVTTALPCGPGGQTRACISNGIYLVREGDDRLAIMFLPTSSSGSAEVSLQIVVTAQDKVDHVLSEIRRLGSERSVFRGQVISFGPEMFGLTGNTTPLNFLTRPDVGRDQIVLPDALLAEIERQVLDGVDLQAVVDRTEGVTAPFLKELLRKAALLAAEADGAGESAGEGAGATGATGAIRVTGEHLTTALDQLLASRNQLTRVLLGGQPAAG